jgi:hypothetical protein
MSNDKTPILDHYALLGVTIAKNGDQLRVDGPQEALTPKVVANIRNHRISIFSELILLEEQKNRKYKEIPVLPFNCSKPQEQLGTEEQKFEQSPPGRQPQFINAVIQPYPDTKEFKDWSRRPFNDVPNETGVSALDVIKLLPTGKIDRDQYLKAWQSLKNQK